MNEKMVAAIWEICSLRSKMKCSKIHCPIPISSREYTNATILEHLCVSVSQVTYNVEIIIMQRKGEKNTIAQLKSRAQRQFIF